MKYEFKEIETKWQKYWVENKTYKTYDESDKPKFYGLIEFPFPSGQGLHVGHARPYTAMDAIARKKRMEGYNVLFPMGYDAFGLPAEQYAIQTGQHPEKTTRDNVARYRSQLDRIGFSFDWDREFRTCDPDYYKWTQWAFLKMFGPIRKRAGPLIFLSKHCTSAPAWLQCAHVFRPLFSLQSS